jgi:predicted RNA-binding Zn ribbon-like protein
MVNGQIFISMTYVTNDFKALITLGGMASHPRVPAGDASGDPLAIRFVNTLYGVRGTLREGLASCEQLAGWLRANAASLADGGAFGTEQADVTDADLARFTGLRETIRGLIRARADARPLHPAQVTELNEAAASAPAWPVIMTGPEGITVSQRGDPATLVAAFGAIARDAIWLLSGPAGNDIRACQAPGCVQFFVKDQARRAWCSAGCGNRARVARHYQRHKADSASQ